MVERARVGQDRQVDVGRDVAAERDPERPDYVEDHLAARRGRLVEPVDRAIHAVAGVMVDVDDEVILETGDASPAEIAAFHYDQRIGLDVAPVGDLDAIDARELAIVIGSGIGIDQPDLLAERLERVGHRQLRSDRVTVGTRVRRQQEPPAAENGFTDFRHHVGARGGLRVNARRLAH